MPVDEQDGTKKKEQDTRATETTVKHWLFTVGRNLRRYADTFC